MSAVTIRQVRSANGSNPNQKGTLKALGLGRIGRVVVVANTPSFRGAVKRVLHLVTVEEVDNG